MRVHLFSDLHLEFGPLELPPAVRGGALAELVLLAGDIHTGRRGIRWAARTFAQPVAMILGNHESYGDSLHAVIAAERKHAADASRRRAAPMRMLERETWSFISADGTPVRVVGATLWTDFELFGKDAAPARMTDAQHRMNDFRTIEIADGPHGESRAFSPVDQLRLHRESIAFIADELARAFRGITIVMTHHAPSLGSVPEDRLADPLTAAYASRLEALIERTQPQLWVHGHIHTSSDYAIGSTRVVCNPRGYFPIELNPDFDPERVIELTAS